MENKKFKPFGFNQNKILEIGLNLDDCLILRAILNFYSSNKSEYIIHKNNKYVWLNQTELLNYLPIIGSRSTLMRKLKHYLNIGLIDKVLKHRKNNVKGNFYFIKPTIKINSLTKSNNEIPPITSVEDDNISDLPISYHDNTWLCQDDTIKIQDDTFKLQDEISPIQEQQKQLDVSVDNTLNYTHDNFNNLVEVPERHNKDYNTVYINTVYTTTEGSTKKNTCQAKTDKKNINVKKEKYVKEKSVVVVNLVDLFNKKYNANFDYHKMEKLVYKKGLEVVEECINNFDKYFYNANSVEGLFFSFCSKYNTQEAYKQLTKHTNNQNNNKPIQATNYEQRKYDDAFFDSLYDNVDLT